MMAAYCCQGLPQVVTRDHAFVVEFRLRCSVIGGPVPSCMVAASRPLGGGTARLFVQDRSRPRVCLPTVWSTPRAQADILATPYDESAWQVLSMSGLRRFLSKKGAAPGVLGGARKFATCAQSPDFADLAFLALG